MSSEFIAYGLAISNDEQPNWITITDQDDRFIRAYRKTHEGWEEDNSESDGEIANLLNDSIKLLKEAWEGERLDACSDFVFPKFGVHVLVTGGQTWGDSPSDLYDAIGNLMDAGELLTEMGFEF